MSRSMSKSIEPEGTDQDEAPVHGNTIPSKHRGADISSGKTGFH